MLQPKAVKMLDRKPYYNHVTYVVRQESNDTECVARQLAKL